MATAYARRMFAGGSIVTTVPLSMGASDGSFSLASATNWPSGSSGNFVVVIDFGLSTQEKILCSATSGLAVTVAASGRGYDGTTAVGHSAGASAQVVHCAQDDDEANQVVNAVLGQSGAAKGDILYMLSAAGPNTLQRLAVGANGGLLSAASGVPAWSAAGTSGQLLSSGGTGVPTWIGDASWTSVGNGSMSNSWVNGTNPVAYRLIGSSFYLRGEISGGTAGTVFTLPVGYRPSQAWQQIVFNTTGVTATTISVSTAGVLACSVGTSAWSLDGLIISTL